MSGGYYPVVDKLLVRFKIKLFSKVQYIVCNISSTVEVNILVKSILGARI